MLISEKRVLLPQKGLFKSLNSKLLAIAVLVIAITIALFFFNSLYIQALLVLWNFGAVSALVLWERQKRNDALNSNNNYSNDDRWTKIKMDFEKVENKLAKTKDPAKRKSLVRQKVWLENELRRLEWEIREANMNGMYNAEKGSFRNSRDPSGKTAKNATDPTLSSSTKKVGNLDPLDRLGARAAIRKRAELEIENKERQSLLKTLDSAEAVVEIEPASSLPDALQPIANDCKAHYNLIKKRGKLNTDVLGDYWVAWSLVLSVQNRLPFDSAMTKYASKDFRSRVGKFMKSVDAIRYSKNESIPNVHNESLAGIASDTGFDPQNNGPSHE
jgi:hypothetical protein